MQQIIFRIIITILLLCSMFFVSHVIFFIILTIAGLIIEHYYESLIIMTLFFIGFVYPVTNIYQYSILLLPISILIIHYIIRRYSTLYDKGNY